MLMVPSSMCEALIEEATFSVLEDSYKGTLVYDHNKNP